MVKFNVEFLEDNAVNPILTAAGAIVTNEAKYCKWSIADMIKYQLEFYTAPRAKSIKAFYKERLLGTSIPEKTFGTYWRASGLKCLQEANSDLGVAKIALESYVAHSHKNAKKRTTRAKKSNLQRIFTITPEGDRMKGRITACITTRADGEFECCVRILFFYFILCFLFCAVSMRLIVVC